MLIKDWTLEWEGGTPLPCQAPCTLYGVLYDHHVIDNPFWGLNDQKLTALGERDCCFTAVFTPDEGLLDNDYVELVFSGLDTICHIYLNGQRLDKVQNMHREYRYDVKSRLQPGENTLRLAFQSPVQYFNEKGRRHYLYTNDGDTLPGAAHLRKALYMSGWDWGPALPDMGIFRDVRLEGYNTDRLDSVGIRQRHHDGIVDVTITASTRRDAGGELYAILDGQRVRLEDGEGCITVKNPKLWWVRGYGEPSLYDLDVELVKDGQVLDRVHKRIGLRTLTVSTQRDAHGEGSEFCFVNNGVKIFSMGANYIPQDNLLARVTPAKLEEMMGWCLDANFNTLRVWGGGYYPDDKFFDLCDENGILVWLDFMVACVNVRLSESFEKEFVEEAVYNVKRVQHHACLGLLCGNNEMEGLILDMNLGANRLVLRDYLRLYEHLLPDICETYAPDTFYWPSSPSSGGGFDDPGAFNRGDTHYWKVWHGGVPFTEYRKLKFRFCSEYGFESFPSMKTIRSFCEEKDLNCFSRVMEDHQKCKGGNSKILRYLADNYLYPYSFENLVYVSQLLQADAIQYGVEHFRRQRGYCMGSIYWQFNDCWPVASWSSVDYYGRYKALHYAAKKFYAPVAMGLFLEDGRLTVNVSNETMNEFQGHVRLGLCQADMRELDGTVQDICVRPLSSADVLAYGLPDGDPYSRYLYADLYDKAGRFILRQTELLVPPKHFQWQDPHIHLAFSQETGGVAIAVSASAFAKGVCIDFDGFDCTLSDNFFSLATPDAYHITARTVRSPQELQEHVTVKSLYDASR